MNNFVNRCVPGVFILLLTASLAFAQATASLNGRVSDESGGVLPGVTVTVTQTDTGFTRSVVTEDTGEWLVPNLPTGPYRLEVALQGFKTYQQTGIVLQVAANPTINVVLGVGNLEETVSVEAAAPIVDVRSAGISEVVEQERIVELPLQGRQVTDLITLAGAAIQTGRPNSRSFQGGVNISVAGGLDFGVAYLLDGAMHNDVQNAGGMPLPFPDALQEFRVATSGTSAQNGMHSGASVNAVTKSGTNQFHGNAFEFLRHHRFNATSPFAAIGKDGKRADDGLKRNQYRRHHRWPGHTRQAVFLRRLPGHSDPGGACRQHRLRADGGHARGRLHRVCVAGVQQRPADRAAGAVRQQPGESVALQQSSAYPRRQAADDHRSLRRDTVQSAVRSRRGAGGRARRLSAASRITRSSADTWRHSISSRCRWRSRTTS